jgi:hypothetical protein
MNRGFEKDVTCKAAKYEAEASPDPNAYNLCFRGPFVPNEVSAGQFYWSADNLRFTIFRALDKYCYRSERLMRSQENGCDGYSH